MVGSVLDRTPRCGIFPDEYRGHGVFAGQGQKYGWIQQKVANIMVECPVFSNL